MSTTSIPDNRQVVNPAVAGPCTNVAHEVIGPVTVALYEKWHGAGWLVIARNGHEIERRTYTYYPAALARYTTMRRKYRSQWNIACAMTMLGLCAAECSCNGADRDGCPACRATARRLYGNEVPS